MSISSITFYIINIVLVLLLSNIAKNLTQPVIAGLYKYNFKSKYFPNRGWSSRPRNMS